MRWLFPAILAAALAGCDCNCPEQPKTAEQAAQVKSDELRQSFGLPSNAVNAKYLEGDESKDWITFEVKIGGETRKFLRHVYYDRESTVELTR